MQTNGIEKRIGENRVLAVLTIENAEDAVPTARALLEGGVGGIELALRTNASLEALSRIADEVPEMLIGVGTVLRPDQCHEVVRRGGAFALAPGHNPRVAATAREVGLPFVPGIATASELEAAVESGHRLLKLFPAEHLGGAKYLKSLNGPYKFLGLKYIPLGGVNEDNLGDYLSRPEVLAVGGSWLANGDLIARKDWSTISKNAEAASKIADGVAQKGGS